MASNMKAYEANQRALELDPDWPYSHGLLSFFALYQQKYDEAIAHAEKAVAFAPNDALVLANLASVYARTGRYEEGAATFEKSIRLSPFYPAWFLIGAQIAYQGLGQHEKALEISELYAEREPESGLPYIGISYSLWKLGRPEEAKAALDKVLEFMPNFNLNEIRGWGSANSEDLVVAFGEMGVSEHPPLSLPDKPSIAVLPFANMSDDPEQEWFADGMTDDPITDLSKISGLFVIARNSSFTYKGEAVDVKTVGRELGVKHVLEGSVRRMGDQVRINAQLIDTATGGHLWAERYDGAAEDIFALQEEVLGKIVASLAVSLTDEEQSEIARAPTDNMEAYEHYQRGEQFLNNAAWVREGVAEALAAFENAYRLDPNFAEAYAGYASAAHQAYASSMFWILKGQEAKARAENSALRALVLDAKNARALGVLSLLATLDGDHEVSVERAEQAVAGDPNNVEAHILLALTFAFAGEHAKAVAAVLQGLRLDPKPNPYLQLNAGMTFFFAKRYANAIEILEAARQATPDSNPVLLFLAASYARSDRIDDADAAIATAYEKWPAASQQSWRQVGFPYLKRVEDLEHLISSLALAGLPEWPFGYEGDLANRLSEAELQEQMKNGVTIDGVWDFGGYAETGEGGIPATMRFGPGQRWHWISEEFGEDTGFSTIRDDMKCDRTPDGRLGLWHCGYVYRNPEGTRENKNEYIEVMTDFILYFSVVSAPD